MKFLFLTYLLIVSESHATMMTVNIRCLGQSGSEAELDFQIQKDLRIDMSWHNGKPTVYQYFAKNLFHVQEFQVMCDQIAGCPVKSAERLAWEEKSLTAPKKFYPEVTSKFYGEFDDFNAALNEVFRHAGCVLPFSDQ